MKELVKHLVKKLPFNFTKNQKYDAQTKKVFSKVLKKDSVFVDVGCHKGEVMDLALEYAPNNKHIGFEAIPSFVADLKIRYPKLTMHHIALSDNKGTIEFNYVKSNPAYSGIKQRAYTKEENIELISVQTDMLDNIVDSNVDLIKIDVEGGELGVLKGAKETIIKNRPTIVFEHGLGASEFYNTTPELVWEYLVEELGAKISLMSRFLKDQPSFSKTEFSKQYYDSINYYFIAYFE